MWHTTDVSIDPTSTQRIPLEKIKPLPGRHYFGYDHIDTLSQWMRVYGLREPITVRLVGEDYLIIAGERRWRAAQLLGWRTIDARVESAQ